MNLDNVKHLMVGGADAIRLELNGQVLWKGLPTWYTRLDYIETTGNDSVAGSYIDTGFVPDQDSRVVCEFVFLDGSGIWGARTSTTSNNFDLRVVSGTYQPGYGSTLINSKIKYDSNWHTVDFDKNICTIDGGADVVQFTYAAFKSPKTIALGGINANNRFYYGSCRYRSIQIYDNGVLIRDLVPCRNPDGEVGMYDTVNAKFYGNSGTGELIAGDEV